MGPLWVTCLCMNTSHCGQGEIILFMARWGPPKPMGWRRCNLLLGKTAADYHSALCLLAPPHTLFVTIHFQKCFSLLSLHSPPSIIATIPTWFWKCPHPLSSGSDPKSSPVSSSKSKISGKCAGPAVLFMVWYHGVM